MKQPVRGGLKGGRRSVKRGQSVEFADYRDYSLGDDLRQLDWNVYARLEKLFVKLFVEEEDVTDHLPPRRQPVDGLRPAAEAAVRQARRGGPRVHRPGRRGPGGRHDGALRADGPPPQRPARLRAASSGSWRNLSGIQPAEGPTDLLLAARHAAAMLSGRGVVVLLSDLLDPSADRVIRELAATGSELIVLHTLSPDELDPPLEGDLRLVDSETGEGIDVTVDLAALDDYKARLLALAGEPRGHRPQAPRLVRADRHRHPAGGPRVRRAPPPAGGGLTMSFLAPLALAGLLFLPVVVAMYLLKLRRDEAMVPSTLLWQKLVADVEANAPWQRLRRSLLLLLQLLLVADPRVPRRAPVRRAAGGPRRATSCS